MCAADFVGPIPRERVIATRDHDELRVGEERREMLAHGHRTNRIGITPQKQRGRSDCGELVGQIHRNVEDPRRCMRVRAPVVRAPVARAETVHVDATGGGGQHEPLHSLRASERREYGDDAAHRLGREHHVAIHLVEREAEQIVETAHGGARSDIAKTRPIEQHFFAVEGQTLRHGLPELPVS